MPPSLAAVLPSPRPAPESLALSHEQRQAWIGCVKTPFAHRKLQELSRHLIAISAVPGGDAAEADVAELLRDFIRGEERGLQLVFDPGNGGLPRKIEEWAGLAPGTLDDWLSRALSERGFPEASVAPPGEGAGDTVPPPGNVPTSEHPGRNEKAWRRNRAVGPEARLREILEGSAAPVQNGDTKGAFATSEVREACRAILQGMALELFARGEPPDGRSLSPSSAVEREISETSERSRNTRIRKVLLALLTRFEDIALRSGWMIRDSEGTWSFASSDLPSLLIGDALHAAAPSLRALLRDRVGRDERWAEAAWTAVALGDPIDAWLSALVEEADGTVLRQRTIVTAAALGGISAPPAGGASIRQAFEIVLQTVLLFFPQRIRDRASPAAQEDEPSPWYLAPEVFRRTVWDLAHASQLLGEVLVPWSPVDIMRSKTGALARLAAALDLPARLSEEEATSVVALASPTASARAGVLGEGFFRTFFWPASRVRAALGDDFPEPWMDRFGVPALRSGAPSAAVRLLVLPQDWHPAGLLLNRPALVHHWYEAWADFTDLAPGELIQAWSEAALRLLVHFPPDQPACDLVLDAGAAHLRQRGLWPEAAEALRNAIGDATFAANPDEARIALETRLLRTAEMTEEQLRGLVERWTERPSLPWRSLVQAGAPHEAIARWCIEKLRAQMEAPEASREGPVGILTRGAEVLSTDQWQIAFQQARPALQWLLDNGSSTAIAVLAEACLGKLPSGATIDPKMGEWLRLTIPLSQIFWGRVARRRAGRKVFFDRVGQDAWLGSVHFMEGVVPYGTVENLWELLALRSAFEEAKALGMQANEASGTASWPPFEPLDTEEATRLLNAFEHWLGVTWIFEAEWPTVEQAFLERGRVRPDVFPVAFRQQGDPWNLAPTRHVPLCTAVLMGCARMGADVERPLVTMLERVASSPNAGHELLFLSAAVHSVLLRSDGPGEPLSSTLSRPDVLSRMCEDGTALFWAGLLARTSADELLQTVQAPAGKDVGLGLLDALVQEAPESIVQVEGRPDFQRPLLWRAAEDAVTPSDAFWKAAFDAPPEGLTLRALEASPFGRWTDELLVQSSTWEIGARERVLRRLAGFAASEHVRKACLQALWKPGMERAEP